MNLRLFMCIYIIPFFGLIQSTKGDSGRYGLTDACALTHGRPVSTRASS